MTLDQFLKIIETAGLVVGGLWAVLTFYLLQSKRTAELDNALKLKKLLRQQPVLAIEIRVMESGWDVERSKGFLVVFVVLKNEGDQNMDLLFDKATLTVGRLALENSGSQTIKHQQRYPHVHMVPGSNKLEPIDTRVFRAGQKRQLAFSVPISEAGGYFIEFHTVYQRRDFEGEEAPKNAPQQEPIQIDAVEQTIFFATGKSNGNDFSGKSKNE